jgi:hypothetical protein
MKFEGSASFLGPIFILKASKQQTSDDASTLLGGKRCVLAVVNRAWFFAGMCATVDSPLLSYDYPAS